MTTLEDCVYTTKWHLPVSLTTTLCNFIASIGCFYFIFSIVSNKSTRKNTFNLYVVFLILPDGLNTFATAIVGVFKALGCGTSLPDWYGAVYDFNNFFFYLTNFYLNCCVAYEVFAIVKGSERLRKIRPPTMRRMFLQVGCVYTASFLFALWGVLDVPWSFYDSKTNDFGSPTRDGEGGLFNDTAAVVFMGILSGFPIFFVVAIRIQLWRKKLIRNFGRTRTLYLFFERITIVFIVMYIPCVSLNIAFVGFVANTNKYYWTERAIHTIKALQALVTLYIVAFKHDIRKAVKRGCCCCAASDTDDDVKTDPERSERFSRSSTTLRPTCYSDSFGFSIAAFRGNVSANRTSSSMGGTLKSSASAEACNEEVAHPHETHQPTKGAPLRSIDHTGLINDAEEAQQQRDGSTTIPFGENDTDPDDIESDLDDVESDLDDIEE